MQELLVTLTTCDHGEIRVLLSCILLTDDDMAIYVMSLIMYPLARTGSEWSLTGKEGARLAIPPSGWDRNASSTDVVGYRKMTGYDGRPDYINRNPRSGIFADGDDLYNPRSPIVHSLRMVGYFGHHNSGINIFILTGFHTDRGSRLGSTRTYFGRHVSLLSYLPMSRPLLVRDAESDKAYVRTADPDELPALAKLLRRAFINDPMMNYIANLEEVRDNRCLFFHLDLAQFAGSLFQMTPKRLDDVTLKTSNTWC